MLVRSLKRCFSYSLTPQQKIIFFGSFPVGYPTLNALIQKVGPSSIEVVTHSNTSSSQINPLQQLCHRQKITYYTPINKHNTKVERKNHWRQFIDQLMINSGQKEYKLGVVCSFGYMIPEQLINLFGDSMILVHPSLIPKYRGSAPIFHAIANGDKISGVSYLNLLPKSFDTGNLLHQVQCQINPNKYYREIEQELSVVGADNIGYVMDNLNNLRPGKSQQQLLRDNPLKAQQISAKIYRGKHLSPNNTAQRVYNLSRAIEGPRLKLGDKDIIFKFDDQYIEDKEGKYKNGQLVLHGKKLLMKCNDKLIKLKSWQEPTKKELPMHMFINQFVKDRKSYDNSLFVS